MTTVCEWQKLPVRQSPHQLPLLYRAAFGLSDYDLMVTDLKSIWLERLSRKDVIRRAFDLSSSIDPSEGPDQLRLLFLKLQAALGGEDGSELVVLDRSEAGTSMKIDAKIALPYPLEPLVWNFAPERTDRVSVAHELIVPTMSHLVASRRHVQMLVSQLEEKDRIIGRFLDKFQSIGIDLNAVFPNMTTKGSKSMSRESAMKGVIGLRPFDENAWREGTEAQVPSNFTISEILGKVLPLDRKIIHDPLPQSNHLKPSDTTPSNSRAAKEIEQIRISTSGSPVTEDGFQRQTTPERRADQVSSSDSSLKSHRNAERLLIKPSKDEDGDETTDSSDSEDLDQVATPHVAEEHSSAQSSQTNLPNRSAKRIGVLGGNKAEETLPPQLENDARSPVKPAGQAKLGRIGGTKAVSSLRTNTTVSSGSRATIPSIEKPRSDYPILTHSSKIPSPPTRKRETSEERANRKRAELKKELDDRSKAPIKKKRRF
ncbi:hypothetical protein MMC25_003101 [Agyrium rufum]|nr:hypothetical protein [Agyrium rufum]